MPWWLEKLLAQIRDGEQALTKVRLSRLSSLSPEETKLFCRMWPDIGESQRRRVVARLVQLAAQDVELNFDSVFQACLDDPDAGVRARAIDGLEECQDCRLIGKLIALFQGDRMPSVRVRAGRALGRFAMLAELRKIHGRYGERLASALLEAFHDLSQPEPIRAQALEAVAPLSLPQVTEAIQEAYHSSSPRLRSSAITAMGLNADPAWLDILTEELGNSDVGLRQRAVRACAELGEPKAVPHLVQLLDDPEDDVRRSAIQALGEIGGSQAKQVLRGLCQHPEAGVRQLAEAALEALTMEEGLLSLGF
ncbi:MAG TPA: HEAT repeat domain-containing protein [Dehalococcoidia bacterium]|nr:HEAT repeat domain-containing protein [Dehalococcoidia bacterium]